MSKVVQPKRLQVLLDGVPIFEREVVALLDDGTAGFHWSHGTPDGQLQVLELRQKVVVHTRIPFGDEL